MIVPALLLLLVAVRIQEAKPLLTDDELLEMVREAIPAVEKATGVRFKAPVWVRISARAEVERDLAEELIPQMRLLEPGSDPKDAPEHAKHLARIYGEILIAKYAWKKGTIHVVPATLRKLAAALEQPALLERDVLRVIVTHELVHALDYEEYDVLRDFTSAKTPGDLEIRNALSEGHAQHVTRRVFEAAGKLAAFEMYEKSILARPPRLLGEAEQYLASLMTASLKMAYVDGRAFFDALEKTGRKTYVQDAFRNPPASKNGILQPERFYDVRIEPAFDPGPAFEAFGKDFGPEWTRRTEELDQGELRTTFGTFVDAKEVEAALKTVLDAHAFILNPKRAPQSKVVAAVVLRLESAAAATKLLELSVRLSKEKDKKFTGDPFKITKADYGTLALPGGNPNVLIRKSIRYQGQDVALTSIVGTAGAFEFEVVVSNEEAGDERIQALVGKLLEGLPKP
ncbi:MAG TPA: hypothetical protein VFC90_04775 [Planctomycetota bacterium]|nr:hypothetical protein [Planctomycetota bacterium]